MLLNATTGHSITLRKSEPPEKISEIQFSPGNKHKNLLSTSYSMFKARLKFCVRGSSEVALLC